MSNLSDPQRRLICRLAFVLGCLVPTGVTFYLIMHPLSAGDWARLIKAETGVSVQIAQVETPTPTRIVFRNVSFSDGSLAQVGCIPEIHVEFDEIVRVSIRDNINLDSLAISEMVRQFRDGTLAQARVDRLWSVALDKVTISDSHRPDRSLLVSDVAMSIEPRSPREMMMQLAFRVSGAQAESDIALRVLRDDTVPVAFHMTTGEVALPVWLVDDVLPQTSMLGSDGSCAMTLNISNQGGTWNGDCHAYLMNVDLASITRPLTAHLSGSATLNLKCDIRDGKVAGLEGQMRAANGKMDPLWLAMTGMDQPEPLEYLDAFADFEISEETVMIHRSQIATRDQLQPMDRSGTRGPLQEVVHFLTTTEAERVAFSGDPPLNNRGVELLRHFQLNAAERTAANVTESIHR
jgi:hypothetical protein